MIKQDCPYEMYRHAKRADSAKLVAGNSCRPASAIKWIWIVTCIYGNIIWPNKNDLVFVIFALDSERLRDVF